MKIEIGKQKKRTFYVFFFILFCLFRFLLYICSVENTFRLIHFHLCWSTALVLL